MLSQLKRVLFRFGWDTRCRNLAPARILRPVLAHVPSQSGPVLLDVGCGSLGVAAFLPDVSVVGVDTEPVEETTANFTFQIGSVTALPFADDSFPVVSCIDVLEHLPPTAREAAINELTRVASRAVLIACPHGRTAHDCDLEFSRASVLRGRAAPNWVDEHLRQPYPTLSTVMAQLEAAVIARGRRAQMSLSYCEPAAICRFVRASATRSDLLYAGVNLLLGALLPLIPAANSNNSYRMILLAEMSSSDAGPGDGGFVR